MGKIDPKLKQSLSVLGLRKRNEKKAEIKQCHVVLRPLRKNAAQLPKADVKQTEKNKKAVTFENQTNKPEKILKRRQSLPAIQHPNASDEKAPKSIIKPAKILNRRLSLPTNELHADRNNWSFQNIDLNELQLEVKKKEIQVLNVNLEFYKDLSSKMNDKVVKLQTDYALLEQKYSTESKQYERKINEMKNQLKMVNSNNKLEIATLKTQMNDKQIQLDCFNQTRNNDAIKWNNRLMEMMQQAQLDEGNLNQANNERKALKAEIDLLRNDNKRLQTEKENLNEQLEAYQRQLYIAIHGSTSQNA